MIEPYLPSADLQRTETFWSGALGFEVTGRTDTWLRVAHGEVAFMFGLSEKETHPSRAIFVVRTDDVAGLHDAIGPRARPEWGPRETPDARRELAYRDPDGHLVNFTQNLAPEEGSA